MQERPFDYPGSQPDDSTPPNVLELGSFTVDGDEGESFDRYTTYSFGALYDAGEIEDYVHEAHPSYRCEHEHDCCGHFYPSGARWSFASRLDRGDDGPQTVIVKQSFILNV